MMSILLNISWKISVIKKMDAKGFPSHPSFLKINLIIKLIFCPVLQNFYHLCGIGFGIYGILQSSQKDTQISDLKTEIKELETVEKESEPITINTEIKEVAENIPISTNVLTNIKELGSSTYGFKSINSGNGTVYAYIDSDSNLILEKDRKYTIASNVIFEDFLWEGNGGAPSLYFVKDDGSVGVIKNVTYDTSTPVAEEITTNAEAISVKNVTTQGGHKVIIVDTNGNFVDL